MSVIEHKIPHVLEHRLTVYHRKDGKSELGITPGHDTRPAPPGLMPYGGELPPRIARECFRCHATQLAAGDDEQRFDENTMIPNVSCERCHGPGKAHVAAARAALRNPSWLSPSAPIAGRPRNSWHCAEAAIVCRLPRKAGGSSLVIPTWFVSSPLESPSRNAIKKRRRIQLCDVPRLPCARFARSPGLRQDMPRLSLRCKRAQRESPAKPAPPCPVSAQSRCVECHMPRKDAGQGILFSDHWIRIHPRNEMTPAGKL